MHAPSPNLSGIPETMLWTLHNRANEAMRGDSCIHDPKCIEIYQAIDYDYQKRFGKAEPSHAARSVIFDREIAKFIDNHPSAVIVNLGEGLETQRFRFSMNPKTKHAAKDTLWFSVDVPDAITIRERFIAPDDMHRHIACSATDTSWLAQVPKDRPVFIAAQGLFMYFEEASVAKLVADMLDYFDQGELMFDVIPRWLSKKTVSAKGWQKTPYYTTPVMPWGIDRAEVQDTIPHWSKRIASVEEVPFMFPRGLWKWLMPVFMRLPKLSNMTPSIQKVTFGHF